MNKSIWLDVRNIELKKLNKMLNRIRSLPIQYLLLSKEESLNISKNYDLKKAIFFNGTIPNDADIVIFDKKTLKRKTLETTANMGKKTGIYCELSSLDNLEWIIQSSQMNVDYAIIRNIEPTNIPIEYIMVRLQNSKTKIICIVDNVVDADVVFGILEKGVDGVILTLNANDERRILEIGNRLNSHDRVNLSLCPAEITDIRHVGMGARACLDTVDLLSKDEGILVGSTSSGAILVCSETHYLPYMETRPFRVNAGAVHSYTWLYNFESMDTETRYLTELKAGDKILVVNTKGQGRLVSIGRVKIERRPLLLIKAKIIKNKKNCDINIIVQDDWHVRIFDYKGEIKSITELKIGDKILAFIDSPGRHTGIKINEFIIEK